MNLNEHDLRSKTQKGSKSNKANRYPLILKKDPEALAELMKNMPLTNDGKFLLLEPETDNTANGAGQEDLESEA